jgi:DNA-binding MarR family transcriptional regulator
MKIEEEIKQIRFRNPHQKAIINLIFTYNVLSSRMQDTLRSENITMQQFNILRILRGQYPNPATNNMVKERLLDKNSDVTRIIDRLIREGLVSRVNCVQDRRRVDITITDEGLNLLEKLDAKNDEMDALVHGLSESEAELVSDLLDKMRLGANTLG